MSPSYTAFFADAFSELHEACTIVSQWEHLGGFCDIVMQEQPVRMTLEYLPTLRIIRQSLQSIACSLDQIRTREDIPYDPSSETSRCKRKAAAVIAALPTTLDLLSQYLRSDQDLSHLDQLEEVGMQIQNLSTKLQTALFFPDHWAQDPIPRQSLPPGQIAINCGMTTVVLRAPHVDNDNYVNINSGTESYIFQDEFRSPMAPAYETCTEAVVQFGCGNTHYDITLPYGQFINVSKHPRRPNGSEDIDTLASAVHGTSVTSSPESEDLPTENAKPEIVLDLPLEYPTRNSETQRRLALNLPAVITKAVRAMKV